MTPDVAPMLAPRENRVWLKKEYPGYEHSFAISLTLAIWWGFLWQRRNGYRP